MTHRDVVRPWEAERAQRRIEEDTAHLIAHLHALPGWQEPALAAGLLAALTVLGCSEDFIERAALLCFSGMEPAEQARWRSRVAQLVCCRPFDEPFHRYTRAVMARR